MSEINWGKAPAWADRVILGSMSSSKYWACDDRRQAIKSDYTYYDNIHLDEQWPVSEWRPSPAWSGEGLPPVGTVCEVDYCEQWQQCEVISHFQQRCGMVAAFTVDFRDGAKSLDAYVAESFRPIRTPEQIAADERNKACDRMYGVILDNVPEDRRKNGSDIVEALYDAGLRFSEQPK